ncbi:hypothetical protein [Micromonospora sp. NPDC005710]|uniref:hypothetical protein n=1 Tax=Micromonospora sp. NPDC005710 TaxID=3157051 RepID=UPI00340B3E2D
MLVAGIVALLVLAGAGGLVVWQVTKNDKPPTTREQFRAAVAAMGAAEAVRLLGAPIGGASTDLTVLKGGQATGTVSLGGLKIDVLRVDERTYVKMPATMLPGGDQGDLANRWITGGAGTTALVAGAVTTPAALGKQLADAVEQTSSFPAVTDTVDDDRTRAWRATTPAGVLTVSVDSPHRVLRLVPAVTAPSIPALPSIPSLPSFPSLPDLTGGALHANLAPPRRAPAALGALTFPAPDVEKTYGTLIDNARQLTDAIDTSYRFDLKGKASFRGCGPSSCTVAQTVTNTFSSKDVEKPSSITVDVTVTMTGDGRPVGGCKTARTVKVNATAALSCTNVSPAWSAFYVRARATRGTHIYAAQVRVMAKATTKATVDKSIEQLRKLLELYRSQQENQPKPSAQPSTSSNTNKCDQVNRTAELARARTKGDNVAKAYSRPKYQGLNQTIAILVVCVVKDGSLYDYAATGGVAMQLAQASVAQPARVVPKVGSEHAEPAAIARAKADAVANPLSPIAIYSTNPFCREGSADCLDMVQQEPGSQTVGPQGRERLSRSAIFNPGIVWP